MRAALREVDWAGLRCVDGSAEDVPGRLLDLLRATTDEDADRAYWQIDNHVIVQGRYFEAAPALLAPIGLALASPDVAPPVRRALAELVTEVALGHPHEDEPDPDALAEHVRSALSGLTGVLLGLLHDDDPQVRADVRVITGATEGEA